MYRDIDVIKSGGIELRGMKASLAPRRQQSQAAPKLEKYTFVPYNSDKVILMIIMISADLSYFIRFPFLLFNINILYIYIYIKLLDFSYILDFKY